MATDIRLDEQSIVLDGGEVLNSGAGAGYGFQDRTQNGRWVLYSTAGRARLYTDGPGDVVSVEKNGLVSTRGPKAGLTLVGRGAADRSATWYADDEAARLTFTGPVQGGQVEARQALKFANDSGLTVFNHGRVTGGFTAQGDSQFLADVHVSGKLTQSSTIAVKDDVTELSTTDALSALDELRPVTFRYKADQSGARSAGFIAEDSPALVVNDARDRIALMDVLAVLTKAVQEQGRVVEALRAEVADLRGSR